MAIQQTGEHCKGEDFVDLAQYLREYTGDHPVDIVLQSMCGCRGTEFRLETDVEDGGAKRTCPSCGASAFIGDSEEYWADAAPEPCVCRCEGDRFELGVGFSLRDSGEVKWIAVGQRCTRCGMLGSCVDWKISDGETEHLFEKT